MKSILANSAITSKGRMAMPIGVYTGIHITGASVMDIVSNAEAQVEAVLALHNRYNSAVLLTAMDLSVEAESFGCRIRVMENEIPTVVGRMVSSRTEIEALPIPDCADGRTSVYLETVSRLNSNQKEKPVLGSSIGPFSLAGRLFGVTEILELTVTDPDLVMVLLEKTTQFLLEYVSAFCSLGIAGVVMAEPTAGLLSPRSLRLFSSAYVRRIIEACNTDTFSVILHNCGARLIHLPAVIESGAEILHFGAPMDLPFALEKAGLNVILAGNLDPAAVFLNGSPAEIEKQTKALLEHTREYPNFIISSGCDLPPQTPLENLDAFYNAVNDFS
jgi:uroporphyrinogen decarboxylase